MLSGLQRVGRLWFTVIIEAQPFLDVPITPEVEVLGLSIKRIIAILIVILMFEIFFEIGLFMYQPLRVEIIPRYTEITPKLIYVDRTVEVPVFVNESGERSITIYGVGVHEDNESGEIVEVRISVKDGIGHTYFDTTYHSFGEDLQDSITVIRVYTERYTGIDMDTKDINIRILTASHSIEGTSGSAAMAVGLIALMENKSLKNNTIITGSLMLDGRIASIQSLNTKIIVAKEFGYKTIIIPNTQCSDANQISGISIVCVSNIPQALNAMTR